MSKRTLDLILTRDYFRCRGDSRIADSIVAEYEFMRRLGAVAENRRRVGLK